MYMYLSHECGLQVLLLQYCYSCVHNLTVKSPSKIGFYEINLNHLTLGDSGKGLAGGQGWGGQGGGGCWATVLDFFIFI